MIFIVIQIFFIYRAQKAVHRVKRRDYNILEEYDTYCILSVYILRLTQVTMLISSIKHVVVITAKVLGHYTNDDRDNGYDYYCLTSNIIAMCSIVFYNMLLTSLWAE